MVEIHLSDNSKPCYVGALEGESKTLEINDLKFSFILNT